MSLVKKSREEFVSNKTKFEDSIIIDIFDEGKYIKLDEDYKD